jgi:hypothetical protein
VEENRSLRWLIWTGPLFAVIFLIVGQPDLGLPGAAGSAAPRSVRQ